MATVASARQLRIALSVSVVALGALVPLAPADTEEPRPTITGRAVVGETLRAERPGSAADRWTWWRCAADDSGDDDDDDDVAVAVTLDDDECDDIDGAEASTYVVAARDIGFRLRVSADKRRGGDADDDARLSNPTDVVRAAEPDARTPPTPPPGSPPPP
ncbi:MAG: hypothetical protein AVDCRST_MAG79-2396, partial [uncultured Thermoleophilia bacterium]